MKWLALFLVPLLFTTLALACEEEKEEAAVATPSPAITVTATPQARPSPEEAIVQWARQECVDPFCGWEYAGDCSSAAAEERGRFCSSLFESGDSQRVYSVGPTQSQFAKWLLLEQQADGTWLVVDSAVVEETLEPAQPPWSVAGG